MKRLLLALPVAALSVALAPGAPSRTETDLRAALAESQAQTQTTQAALVKAKKDRDDLLASINAFNLGSTKRADAATEQRNVASSASEANASDARRAVTAAELADNKAVVTAIAAKLQTDALIRVNDQNNFAIYATLITGLFTFLSVVTGFVAKFFTDGRDHRWVVDASSRAEQVSAVHRAVELEKLDTAAASARAAYVEANHVNQKIENIGLRVADNLPLNPMPHAS